MKKVFLLSLLSVLLYWSNASATIINFDSLIPGPQIFTGTPVGDAISYPELTFEGTNITATTDGYYGIGYAHSKPNKLTVLGGATHSTEETSIGINFNIPVTDVSFWLTGTFHDTTVNAYDAGGNLISSFVQTYPTNEPSAPDGTPWDIYYNQALRFVNVGGSGISRVSIQPALYDGFSIDDVSYNSIPEPATLSILGLGLLGLVFKRKKAK